MTIYSVVQLLNPTTILFFLFKRCAGAGHLRDEIVHYRKELEKCPSDDEETRSYLMDMGIKALRSV